DEAQGEAVLRDLAAHPSTARFIAVKLARHFIADDPPEPAVERIARAFRETDGDLPAAYRALIDCAEAWREPLAKYKTPTDYILSAFRGLDVPPSAERIEAASFELLGQRTYGPGSPAGWPDRAGDWDGASALLKRIEWADALAARIGSRRRAAALAPHLLGATLTAQTRTVIERDAVPRSISFRCAERSRERLPGAAHRRQRMAESCARIRARDARVGERGRARTERAARASRSGGGHVLVAVAAPAAGRGHAPADRRPLHRRPALVASSRRCARRAGAGVGVDREHGSNARTRRAARRDRRRGRGFSRRRRARVHRGPRHDRLG